jgi:hypothetical protein
MDLLTTARAARRRLLAAAASLPAIAWSQPSPDAAAAAAEFPRDVGRKFNADGTPCRFEGNTFLGHLVQQGSNFEAFDAWLDIVRELPRHGFARKLTLVPTSSWHVTLIGGVNEVDRQTPMWPTDVPRDTPIADVHRLMRQRLGQRRKPPLAPCSFVVDAAKPASAVREGTLKIPLRPLDEATARRLREARDELADLMNLRRPDHDRYGFHVTIGYLVRFLNAEEAAGMQRAADDWRGRLAAHGPLTIPSFHFCLLRDMFAFKEMQIV